MLAAVANPFTNAACSFVPKLSTVTPASWVVDWMTACAMPGSPHGVAVRPVMPHAVTILFNAAADILDDVVDDEDVS